ncbi:bifunctional GRAM domain/VASt domain/PH-like domain superfamily/SH3 domain/SH3-like domain superfamily [Babesia duncani]|uniref:Bifunctional GRAM domain/VASt domain/PH-like domain superfamily/SH3 domain/SH3-like domain superfamily n=1 Tax=Babesia duncani TaxID=323732 RepID=A0AAD9PJN4_9APIC|nr:bifunctional GRAM domain/VASt domain/PH-like domain superfamily/SH3 domain/SH3-like domain superfamily [Babesia duncani]
MPLTLNAAENLTFLERIYTADAQSAKRCLLALKDVKFSKRALSKLESMLSLKDVYEFDDHIQFVKACLKRVEDTFSPTHHHHRRPRIHACQLISSFDKTTSTNGICTTSNSQGIDHTCSNISHAYSAGSFTDGDFILNPKSTPGSPFMGTQVLGKSFSWDEATGDVEKGLLDNSRLKIVLKTLNTNDWNDENYRSASLIGKYNEDIASLTLQDAMSWKLLCQCQRGFLHFILKTLDMEISGVNYFTESTRQVSTQLQSMIENAEAMSQTLREQLKSYSGSFLFSVSEYKQSCAKFVKLKKGVENAALKCSTRLVENVPITRRCSYEGCGGVNADNVAFHQAFTSDPADFIRWTNYVEQLCLTDHKFNNLCKKEEAYIGNLTSVFRKFCHEYPRQIYSVQISCLEKLAKFPSVVLGFYLELAECLYQILPIFVSFAKLRDVWDLSSFNLSCNNSCSSFQVLLINSALGIFSLVRDLVRKLSKFYEARHVQLQSCLSDATLAGSSLNEFWIALSDHYRIMYESWSSVYGYILELFINTDTRNNPTLFTRRFSNDFSSYRFNPGLKQDTMDNIVIPIDYFDRLSSILESLVTDGIQSGFMMGSTMLRACSKMSTWEENVARIATSCHIDRTDLLESILNVNKTNTFFLTQVDSVGLDIKAHHFDSYDLESDNYTDAENKAEFVKVNAEHKTRVISLNRTFNALEMYKDNLAQLRDGSQLFAKALVDYSEHGTNFQFKRGDVIHVKIAGGTCLWYGHSSNGIYRWFPAKFVEIMDNEPKWYRKADLEVSTYLDKYANVALEARKVAPLALSSKSELKQSFVLAKLGLEGRVEHEFRCALCRRIVLRGSLYISKTHIGFISSFNDSTIFGQQTTWITSLDDIADCYNTAGGGRFSFYFKIVLKNSQEHTFHSMMHARRICETIRAVAKLKASEKKFAQLETVELDGENWQRQLEDIFGLLDFPAPSCQNEVDMPLEEYFNMALRDNVGPDCAIARTRHGQHAFDFQGDVDPVDFDWSNADEIQIVRRELSYKLKDKRFTVLVSRFAQACATESLIYALVKGRELVYQSSCRMKNIPYANYFYTVIRITATAISEGKTHVKAQHKVVLVRNTLFSSIIRSEASERLDGSAAMVCMKVGIIATRDSTGDFENSKLASEGAKAEYVVQPLSRRKILMLVCLSSITGLCAITLRSGLHFWGLDFLFG